MIKYIDISLSFSSQQDREVEEVENAARQARLKGSSVRYGDTVQLQHMLTGKYIGVSTTHTSVLEKSKLKVGEKIYAVIVMRSNSYGKILLCSFY